MATFKCNKFPSFGFNTPDGVGHRFVHGVFCTDDLPDDVAELAEETLRSIDEAGVYIFEDGVDYGSKLVLEAEEAEDASPITEEGESEFAFLDGETSLGTTPDAIPEGSEL